MAREEDLLKEIRESFEYQMAHWREIREEARVDMQFIAGDPWDPQERQRREAKHRPCLNFQELTQYTNAAVNNVRVAKRAIKLSPVGSGATDDLAEFRANLIRQIEYKSNAQSAYATAYQNAVERSYGFVRIGVRYVSPNTFDQELVIRPIPNPDTVLLDIDAKEPDFSDGKVGFVIESYSQNAFKKQWPKAEVKTFTTDLKQVAPLWIKESDIQVAEAWRVEQRGRVLLLIQQYDGATAKFYKDELEEMGIKIDKAMLVFPDGSTAPILRERRAECPTVAQYITNGVEILEKNPWPGQWIPIVGCFGKELYLDNGSGSKRIFESLIRHARDPQRLVNYYMTTEAEVVGMVPKTPFVGYEGQFENHEDEWQHINHNPQGYIEIKPITDGSGSILPKPERPQYEPAIQALEVGAESARRKVQSAMGTAVLPTAAQRQNQKSGVALERIQEMQEHGSFHFMDNYDRFISFIGRQLNDLIPVYYESEGREIGIRRPDEVHEMVKINQRYKDGPAEKFYDCKTGDYDVTITTGPSYQSQREEAADFADTLAKIPELVPRIADLLVKLRNLGPIGDQIAKRLTPPDIAAQEASGVELPPQVLSEIQAMKAQMDAMAKALEQAAFEKQAKIVESEAKAQQVAVQEMTKLVVAEMQVQAEKANMLLQAELGAIKQKLDMFQGAATQLTDAALAPPPQEAAVT